MSAKDRYHVAVRQALEQDGWKITHDPYTITVGQRSVFVDLGAERLLAAERGTEKIAVEVKTFEGNSDIREMELALGQYVLYRSHLTRVDPERKLYLAIPKVTADTTFTEPIALPVLQDLSVAYIVYAPEEKTIIQWKP